MSPRTVAPAPAARSRPSRAGRRNADSARRVTSSTCSRRRAADDERGHLEGDLSACDEIAELLLCGVEQRGELVVVGAVRERPATDLGVDPRLDGFESGDAGMTGHRWVCERGGGGG